MEQIFFFILLIVLMLSPIILIFGIAFGANASRNRKRRQIEECLPAEVKYKAAVRLNSEKGQHKFWKFKGFEFSGIIYVLGDKICIEGTKGQKITYALQEAKISWVGVNAKNGLIEWFSVEDNNSDIYYVNGETGALIFSVGKGKYPPTSQIYSSLLSLQQMAMTPPPLPSPAQ